MSNNAQSPVDQTQQAVPGFLQTLDYLMTSGQRVAEGIIGYKLLNTELKAREADAQWRNAAIRQLYGSQTSDPSSPWGGYGGSSGIQLPGVSAAGMGGMAIPSWGLPVAIGLGLALLLAKR